MLLTPWPRRLEADGYNFPFLPPRARVLRCLASELTGSPMGSATICFEAAANSPSLPTSFPHPTVLLPQITHPSKNCHTGSALWRTQAKTLTLNFTQTAHCLLGNPVGFALIIKSKIQPFFTSFPTVKLVQAIVITYWLTNTVARVTLVKCKSVHVIFFGLKILLSFLFHLEHIHI